MSLALACSAPPRETHHAEAVVEAPHGEEVAAEPELPFPEPGCERERWPVLPCESASDPERVGVWMIAGGGWSFAYDGCSVAYRGRPLDDSLQTMFCGANGALVIHAELGDPAPYYRARVRWEGDELLADTSMGPLPMGRWEDGTFFSRSVRLQRASTLDDIPLLDRPIVCARRVQPTMNELMREHGPDCRDVGGP
jgi:hypothetical protein